MTNVTAYIIAYWAFYATDHPFIACLMLLLAIIHSLERQK